MSLYDLFYNFWYTIFSTAPTEALEVWLPFFSMLSCVSFVMAFFIIVYKVVARK